MSFDPVENKTHALALKQIVGEAVTQGMDTHVQQKHVGLEKDVKGLEKQRWKQHGIYLAIAAILSWLGFSGN